MGVGPKPWSRATGGGRSCAGCWIHCFCGCSLFEEMGAIRCGWEGISSTASKMLWSVWSLITHLTNNCKWRFPLVSQGQYYSLPLPQTAKMLGGNSLLFLYSHIPSPVVIPAFLSSLVSAHEDVNSVFYETSAFCGMVSWGFLCEGGRRLSRAEHKYDVHQNPPKPELYFCWLYLASVFTQRPLKQSLRWGWLLQLQNSH